MAQQKTNRRRRRPAIGSTPLVPNNSQMFADDAKTQPAYADDAKLQPAQTKD